MTEWPSRTMSGTVAELVNSRPDGTPRPAKEIEAIWPMVRECLCGHCRKVRVCAYDLRSDAMFCSDRCLARIRAR